MRKPVFPLIKEHVQGGVYVVLNFLSQVIFYLSLFLGMVMCANEVETKDK